MVIRHLLPLMARYPERLRAFCSFNPLEDYALEELARYARDPVLRRGIKLHLGNSDVQLDNPAHAEQLRRVFRAAKPLTEAELDTIANNLAPYLRCESMWRRGRESPDH
jgi:hypothetical protein